MSSSPPKTKRQTVFGDAVSNNESEAVGCDSVSEKNSSNESDEEEIEEVKGSVARESTQRLRESERQVVKDSISKKKRKKKNFVAPTDEDDDNSAESGNEKKVGDDLLTDEFFKKVDSERAHELQETKREIKMKKARNRLLRKHTTFFADAGYAINDASHKKDQNIEVVAIFSGEIPHTASSADDERQLLLSATLGESPSKAAIAFARGGMKCGKSNKRGSESKKRKSRNEETWKRSRKFKTLGIGSRPGQAATLFVRKKQCSDGMI